MAHAHIIIVLALIVSLLFVPKRHVVTVGTISVLMSAGMLEAATALMQNFAQ